MPAPLRIGLVGFGKMGEEFARLIGESTEMKIDVVVEPSQVNRSKAAEVFSTEVQLFADCEEAMEVAGIDGWIVASSSVTHVPVALQLLKNGQRVLLEKPIAHSAPEAEILRAYVAADSSNLMMGHILLWSPEFLELREKVAIGGEAREISAVRQRSQSHRVDYPNESLFSLLMVHDLYCIQVLTNCRQPVNFAGFTSNHEAGGEHFASARLEWVDSTVATASSNYFLPDEPAGLIDDQIVVSGKDWQAKVSYRGNFEQALRNEIAHFGALLRNEVGVPVGARYEDALQVQSWVDALVASAAKGASSNLTEGEIGAN